VFQAVKVIHNNILNSFTHISCRNMGLQCKKSWL